MFRLMTNFCAENKTSHPTHILDDLVLPVKHKTTRFFKKNNFQMEGQWFEKSSLFKTKVIYRGRN